MNDSMRHLNVKTDGDIIEVWYGNRKRETIITLCVATTGESGTLYEIITFVLCWMAKLMAADAPFNIAWFMDALPVEALRWSWYQEVNNTSDFKSAPWETPVPPLVQNPPEYVEARVGRPYKKRSRQYKLELAEAL